MGSRIGHWILAIGCLLVVAGAAGAVPPQDANYQGRLLDSVGDPLAGPADIEIGVWDSPVGGTRLYREFHQNVGLTDGIFNILIGTGDFQEGTFDADLFAAQNRYLEVIVEGEVLDPRHPFSSVAYALQSGDAETVGGLASTSLVTVENLEATFAGEVSEVSEVQIPSAIARDSEVQVVQTQVTSLQTENASQQTEIAALQAENAALQSRIAALEVILDDVVRDGDTLVFGQEEGMNVQVVSGSGATDGTINGLGNLIVGYNELRGDETDDRSGSHNLIVGRGQSYSSYGGLVTGYQNRLLAGYAAVSGGRYNTASEQFSSVSGGEGNTASGEASSVSGGFSNTASEYFSSVSGGAGNTASEWYSSVSGGYLNTAFGTWSSVTGGTSNTAGDTYASVSGGFYNTASGQYSSVSGGRSNTASGQYSSLTGGQSNTASGPYSSVSGGRWNGASGEWASVAGGGGPFDGWGNEAFADYSAILGGIHNLAGDPAKLDHTIGQRSSISGGEGNTASGHSSSVSGGYSNAASHTYASVSGGYGNTASGQYSSVSGGDGNTASELSSSVSGGQYNAASGDFSSVSGGQYNVASEDFSSVSGGRSNTASGEASSVSGGTSRSVSGEHDWRGGGYFQDQ